MINESFRRAPEGSVFPKCAMPHPFLSLRAQDEGHPFIEQLGMVLNGRNAWTCRQWCAECIRLNLHRATHFKIFWDFAALDEGATVIKMNSKPPHRGNFSLNEIAIVHPCL